MKAILQFLSTVVFFVLIGYGIFHVSDIESGKIIDWIVGTISFIWLVTIVVVPWNAHFKAKEVLDDAEISQRKDILVIESSLAYVKKVAKRSLYLAIGLHILTAIVLYLIAALGWSPVGYFSAGAAILLTFFRPTLRFYEYLQKRLQDIRQEFRYPRQDLRELLNDVKTMKAKVEDLEGLLDTDPKKPSWRQDVERQHTDVLKAMTELETFIETYKAESSLAFNQYKSEVTDALDKVKKEAKQRYEKLIGDSQILDSVRTLAGFVKEVKG